MAKETFSTDRFMTNTSPSVEAKSSRVFGCEVPILEHTGSQQHSFQFEKGAQQLVRMRNVAATFAMGVNHPTPAISGNGAAITP
jgi:hypothetical protein